VPETHIEMEGLTYGNGIFAAVDRFGSIYTSLDGITWKKMNTIPGWIGGIDFGGGYLVAGGYSNIFQKSLIVSSTDGVNWAARYLGIDSWLTGTPIYVNLTFIISGSYGTGDWLVLQSDPVGGPEVISAPNVLSGPGNGLEKVSYSYSTGGSFSNFDHPVQYLFDWGDGTTSGWLPIGTTAASKSWASGGTYSVKVQARCANHTTVVSPWSTTFPVTIIKTTLSVGSPNGGETLTAGSMQTIRWTYTGNPGSAVKIELLKGGVSVSTISYYISIGSAGSGSFNWSIPSTQVSGSDYQIRVTSLTNAAYSDISDSVFTIVGPPPPTISVTSPNGGETLTAGSAFTIRWNYGGNPGSAVKIELLKGGILAATISYYTSIGSAGSGSFNWSIPSTQVSGSDYQIKVTSLTNAAYSDTSDSNFTIVGPPPPTISVTSPNGGETLTAGSMQILRWSYTGNPGSAVKIELLKGGVLTATISYYTSIGSAGSGSFNWSIPSNQVSGGDYQIKVASTNNSAYSDISDGVFTIVGPPPPTISVTSPNGAETLTAGSMQTIRWSYTGNPGSAVKIELVKGGVLTATISYSTWIGSAGSGSFNWSIPSTQMSGSDYQIKVTSATNSAYTDTSDNNFTISK
jgi:Kre9/KNH-like N-terminal Ig-like domain